MEHDNQPITLSSLLAQVFRDELAIYLADENQMKLLPDIIRFIIEWRFAKRFVMIQKVDNIIELYGNLRGNPTLGSELFILLTSMLQRWFLKQYEYLPPEERVPSLTKFIEVQADFYSELLSIHDDHRERSLIDDASLHQGYDEDLNWRKYMLDHPALIMVIAIHYLDAGVVLTLSEEINEVFKEMSNEA